MKLPLFHSLRCPALTAFLVLLGLWHPARGQEPPMPPETPPEPQAWWPTQPMKRPFVHSLFSSDMVLQRDCADPIWGWSSPGNEITISVTDARGAALGKGSQAVAMTGADGKWMTKIGPFAAGGPLTIAIKDSQQQVTLTNVLVGDVWLCSGQSNMSWPVRSSLNAEAEIAQGEHPEIRSFTVPFYPSYLPMSQLQPASWEQCSPKTVPNFSAVGYFFAREINQRRKIPIGIIHSSVGATAAEVWVSADGIRKYMPYDFHEQLDRLAADAGDPASDYFQEAAKWTASVDPASVKQGYVADPRLNTSDWQDIAVPKAWEEGMPDFDGLVWFRTEVEVPETWVGKPVALNLGQINDTDITWFNGALVGINQMKGNFRRYQVDAALVKPGRNILTVAVINKAGPGGFCGLPPHMTMRSAADPKEIALAGTWKAKRATAWKDIARPFPKPKVGYYKTVTGMDNGMIAPLAPFAIKGALWWQGEASWPFWLQYRRLMPAIIADWRDRFQVGDFPFLLVSLSTLNEKQKHPTEPGYGELRESLWRTARTVPNVGLAIAADLGDEPRSNIHTKNKQDVGLRLALVARKMVYGEKDLVASGPEFTEMMMERIKEEPPPAASGEPPPKRFRTRLYFTQVGSGLVFKPGNAKPNGFAVSSDDKEYFWADAVIEGDTVVVSAPEVAVPRYVRYGWSSNPIITLFNKEGLPAIPFRTVE